MKVLVTGASGLLGQKVAQLALEKGYHVYAIYKEHKISIGIPVKLDLTNREKLLKVMHACMKLKLKKVMIRCMDKRRAYSCYRFHIVLSFSVYKSSCTSEPLINVIGKCKRSFRFESYV